MGGKDGIFSSRVLPDPRHGGISDGMLGHVRTRVTESMARTSRNSSSTDGSSCSESPSPPTRYKMSPSSDRASSSSSLSKPVEYRISSSDSKRSTVPQSYYLNNKDNRYTPSSRSVEPSYSYAREYPMTHSHSHSQSESRGLPSINPNPPKPGKLWNELPAFHTNSNDALHPGGPIYNAPPIMTVQKSSPGDMDMDEVDDDVSSAGGDDQSKGHRVKRRAIEKKSRMRRVDALENLRRAVSEVKQPQTDPLTQNQRKNCQADICFDAVEIIGKLRYENEGLRKQFNVLASQNRDLENRLNRGSTHPNRGYD